MAYYQGDYYAGDPFIKGLFRKVKKAVGTVVKATTSFMPGPVGAIGGAIGGALAGGRKRQIHGGGRQLQQPMVGPMPTIQPGYFPGKPTGTDLVEVAPGVFDVAPKRRRSMNYGNVKALRRADRRISGFVRVAKSALKHTNYKVTTKGAGRRSSRCGTCKRSSCVC